MTYDELLKFSRALLAENTALRQENRALKESKSKYEQVGFTNGTYGGYFTWQPTVEWIVPDKLVLFIYSDRGQI